MSRVRPISLMLLVACVAAACVSRRFVYMAWYPVVMSAAVATAFALSLLRRKTLCEEMAERIPPHVLPPGAASYCRKYTLLWAAWLVANGLIAVGTIYAPGPVWRVCGLNVPWVWVVWNMGLSYLVTGAIVLAEMAVRRRRFARVFHTSGSTATPKRIVKTFATLAKEVAYHRSALNRELGLDRTHPVFLATIEPEPLYGILWRVLLPQAAGCRVDPEVIRTPEALLAKMRAAERVVLVTTPSFLERFCAYADQYDVPRNCVEIVTSGALLAAPVAAAAQRVFGCAPREVFGATETGGVAWRRQDGREDAGLWTLFGPVCATVDAEGRLVVTSPFACARPFTMGDAVELLPDGRHFKLLGRCDRVVKINEQRVSLPELEAKMETLPEVRAAALCPYAGAHGPTLGAVVVLDDAAFPGCGKRACARALRLRLRTLFPAGTVPHKYRFVAELPHNAQGKVQVAALERLLAHDFSEPRVFRAARTPCAWSADLVFDPEATCFKGHFPGAPVLPGVVQVGTAFTFANMFAGEALRLRMVKKLKFVHTIRPGDVVHFVLSRTASGTFDFTYAIDATTCSSGTLVAEAIHAENP